MRINAQLVDAETGAHVWAERFDKAVRGSLCDAGRNCRPSRRTTECGPCVRRGAAGGALAAPGLDGLLLSRQSLPEQRPAIRSSLRAPRLSFPRRCASIPRTSTRSSGRRSWIRLAGRVQLQCGKRRGAPSSGGAERREGAFARPRSCPGSRRLWLRPRRDQSRGTRNGRIEARARTRSQPRLRPCV